MTPQDAGIISTAIGDLKFERETSLWLLQHSLHPIEVAIGGGASGPSEPAIKFAERLLPILDQLAPVARKYLDEFIKKDQFDEDVEWFLEGLLLEAPPVASPDHFGLCFTHAGDIYGHWTVIFRDLREHERKQLKAEAWPIAFHRAQQ